MIVYRFEYEDGSGIYFRSDGKSFCCIDDGPERHPNPYQELRIMESVGFEGVENYHFGFSSMEQLRSWFYSDNHLHMMHEKGVVISEYECHVQDVVVGNAQTIFIRSLSISKKQYNIIEYFNLEK